MLHNPTHIQLHRVIFTRSRLSEKSSCEEKIQFFDIPSRDPVFYFAPESKIHQCRTITNSFSCYTCISSDDDPFSTNRCSTSVFFLFIFPQPHLRSQRFFVTVPASIRFFFQRFCFPSPTDSVRDAVLSNELWLISRNDVYWPGFIFFFSWISTDVAAWTSR